MASARRVGLVVERVVGVDEGADPWVTSQVAHYEVEAMVLVGPKVLCCGGRRAGAGNGNDGS